MPALTLTPTQRRYLKQIAHPLKPLLQMGKDGPSADFMRNLNEHIELHELIKVRILNNCLSGKDEITGALDMAEVTVVQKVGNVYTVFKQKEKDSQLALPKR